MCEPGNKIADAGATALAPSLKGLTALTVLRLKGEWVIGCVVTVDRMSSDIWPLSPRDIGTGCALGRLHGKHLAILTLSIYTVPSPSPILCVLCEPGNKIGEAGATALAPSLKGLPALTYLDLQSEWVIGCVITVDRISNDT